MEKAIRKVLPADRTAALEILSSTGVFSSAEMAVAAEVLDSALQDGEASGYPTYLLVTDTKPAGYICFGPTPMTEGTWDIYWLGVLPAYQHHGIGRELLRFAEDKIRRQKGRLILIETSSRPDYEAARSLYLASGYKVEAVVRDFYSPKDDKVVFAKRLT